MKLYSKKGTLGKIKITPQNGYEYFKVYDEEYNNYADEQLSERFNGLIQLRAFNFAIQEMHAAIRAQFIEQIIDFSEIGNDNSLSFFNKIRIEGKKNHKNCFLEKPRLF